MLLVFGSMFLVLVLAGMVVVYVAYPHRRKAVPGAPWLGTAMRRGVAALPTIDNQESHERAGPETGLRRR